MENLGPNLIAHNGKVITVDESFSVADSVAVKACRIIGVGGGAAMLEKADGHTRIIDLAGRVMMPGLIDGHAHMDREGLKYLLPSLEGARSIEDILGRIEALVAQAEPGAWVFTMPIGDPPSYFDLPEMLAEKRFPTRHDLDRVSPHNPVYIRSIWGFWRHALPLVSVANSKALEAAGITRQTQAPCDTVEIVKDETGEPTGVFVEHTFMPIVELSLMRAAGGFSHADRVGALHTSMQAYHAFGTTSIFEEHGVAGEVIRVYKELWEKGDLTMRSNLVFSPSWGAVEGIALDKLLESWATWMGGRGLGDDVLRIGGLYGQIATETGNGSATECRVRAQAGPYTGWAGFNYDCVLPGEKLVEVMVHAARNDIRMVTLTGQMLENIEAANRIEPIADKRWVLGHIGVLTEDETKRIADLGLATSTHTNRNIYRTGSGLVDKIGIGRAADISPLARMRDAGIHFALATDNVPTSLFHPIWQAVTRTDRATGQAIAPEQGISREDALRAATIEGAYLTMTEKDKGSIEVGKLADFAILSADPLTVPEDQLADIAAEMTIVGGRVVYPQEAG